MEIKSIISFWVAIFIATLNQIQTSVGAELIISVPTQPVNSIAPQNARVPFTKVTLTATNGDAKFDGFQVVRTGLGDESVFKGIVLLDENNLPIGNSESFEHLPLINTRVNIGATVIITNNSSRTFTVAGDMATNVANWVGQTISLTIVRMTTDGSAVEITPITGASHTVNNGLVIGSLAISKSSLVIDQNIELAVPNRVLGGFRLNNGSVEHLVVRRSLFFAESDFGTTGFPLTNIRLYNSANVLVAGPVDAKIAGTFIGSWLIEFTDPFIVPKGGDDFIIKGNVGSPIQPEKTVKVTVLSEQWDSMGVTYGYTLVPPSANVVGQTMTVKGPRLRIRPNPTFQPQRTFGGRIGVALAQFILDASESSEDVRLPALQLSLSVSNVSALHLTNCQLFDGVTPVTSGANLINPSVAGAQTFTFDGSGIVVPKGTIKTLTLKADITASIGIGSITWSATSPQQYSGVGVTSSVAASVTADPSGIASATKPYGFAKGNVVWVRDIGPGDPLWVGAGLSTVASIEFDCDPARRYKIQVTTDLKLWRDAIAGAGFMPTDASGKISCHTYFTRTNGLTNVFRAVAE